VNQSAVARGQPVDVEKDDIQTPQGFNSRRATDLRVKSMICDAWCDMVWQLLLRTLDPAEWFSQGPHAPL